MCASFFRKWPTKTGDQRGFTLIELVMVILIVVVISGLAVNRLGSLGGYKSRAALRNFIDTWQFLYHEAEGRREDYRLVIDLDRSQFYVRREVPPEDKAYVQVDYLKNLRTKGEQERRAKKEEENLKDVTTEFEEEDIRQSAPLETLFYQMLFQDRSGPIELTRPLEFPALAEVQTLPPDLRIKDVATLANKATSGTVFIRFSAQGATDFAVVHFDVAGEGFTAFLDPATGSVILKNGLVDYESTYGKGSEGGNA